jgi:hypothetical protein
MYKNIYSKFQQQTENNGQKYAIPTATKIENLE